MVRRAGGVWTVLLWLSREFEWVNCFTRKIIWIVFQDLEENAERFRILRAGLKRDIDENLTSLQEELEKEDPSKVKLSFGLSHLRDDEKA